MVKHCIDLLVNALCNLGNRETSRTNRVSSKLKRALKRLRCASKVQDVADWLNLCLQASCLFCISCLKSLPKVNNNLGDKVCSACNSALSSKGVSLRNLAVRAYKYVNVVTSCSTASLEMFLPVPLGMLYRRTGILTLAATVLKYSTSCWSEMPRK